ncbi:MAG: hypothetical protein ACYSSP_01075 [Planctomycetota bacterium]|jgi:cell division protein FtsN
MEKRNDKVDKAIEALNKERVRAEPPESVVDATFELLKEAQEKFEYEEVQKKERTAEVLRSSSRFAKVAVAAGIAAAIVLCLIFILELTEKPVPTLVKEEQPQPTEIIQQIEAEEEAIVVEEPVEAVTEDTLEIKLAQISQMAEAGDMEGLRQILREGEAEVQLAAAYYLGRMGDEEAMELLGQLAARLAKEPNETTKAKQEDEGSSAAMIVREKIDKYKKDFKAQGALSGLVLEAQTGEPIGGAEVRIDKGQIYTKRTDVNGYYLFKEVEEAGNYRVGIWSDAYVGIYGWDKMPILNLGTEVNIVQHFELKSACMIQVQVVDEKGEPVEGAELLPTWLGEEFGREVGEGLYSKRTDANGYMLLGGFEASNTPYLITALQYTEIQTKSVRAEAPRREINYTPGRLVLTLKNPDVVETHEIILRKGIRVRGYAEYSDGIPASGLDIIAQPDWWHSSHFAQRVTIEPNGFFTLNHIERGTYDISIYFPSDGGGISYQLLQGELPIEEGLLTLTVPEKSPESLVSISGTISYSEGPLPRYVNVSAASKELGSQYVTIRKNVGEFTINRLEPGNYQLVFSGENIEQKVIENVQAPSEGIEVELKYMAKPKLKGFVVKADTLEPLQHFKVRARKLRILRGPYYAQSNQWFEFRESGGEFDIETVDPGVYQVQVEAEGFAPQWSEEINTDVNEPVTIALSAGGSIKGRVLNERGEPITGAKVIPLSKAGGTMPRVNDVFVSEDGAVETTNGNFLLEHLPVGLETLKAVHPDYTFAVVKDIEVLEGQLTIGIYIVMTRGGTAEGHVYDVEDTPQANVTLYFQDKSGYEGGPDEKAGRFATAITDSNGFYSASGLPEQLCYIRRSDSWNRQGVVQRAFLPSNGITKRIDLGGGPAVSGELIIDGMPLGNNKMLLGSTLGGVFKCISITDSQGRFSFTGVPTGQHYIYHENPQKRNDWFKVANIETGSEDVDIGIIPKESSQIEVYVVNESNDPNLKITGVHIQEGNQVWGEWAGNVYKPETPDEPYIISNLMPSPYTVTASRADNVTIREYIDLSAGEQQLSILIPSGTGTVSGSFTSDNQQYLVIWRADRKVTARIYPRTGEYKIDNLPAGEYTIGNYLLFEKAPLEIFTLNDGETKTVDINTEDFSAVNITSLKTWVVDGNGAPITGATAWLEGDSGDIEPAMNPSIGQYFVAEPGEYILHAYYPGFAEAIKFVLLEAGNVTDMDLDRKEAIEFISLERE